MARWSDERTSFAVTAAAVQTGKLSVAQIIQETEQGPARGRPRLVRTIGGLSRGVRSLPERDFMELADGSRILPPLLYNCLIHLLGRPAFQP